MKLRFLAVALTAMLLVLLLPVGALTASAAGSVDLVVEALDFGGETEVKPGTPITFSVKVTNNGTAATSAPITAVFGTVGKEFARVTHTDPLAAGASVTLKSQPWTAVKGDYMVAVRVNGDKTVAESSYKNNTVQTNLRVAEQKLQSAHDTTAKMLKDGGLTKLVFSDDFDSIGTVDVNNTAAEGYKWYVDRPYGASTLTMDDYSVKNGVMTVHNIVPTYNYGLGTVDCGSHVGWTFNTGYLEVRLRIPRPRENVEGEKGVPAIWALPPEKLYGNDNHWVELDWLEYWGDAYYTVCVHEQIASGGTVYQHNKNSNVGGHGLNDGEWHVMGWLWQKGLLITYYDGEEVMRLTYKEGEYASPMHTTVKGDIMESTFVHMDGQQMPIFIGGSKDNPLELDYVRVWDGGDDYVPPKPTVEKMNMSEFWAAYAADEDMEPFTTANAYNYEQILAGERDYYRMDMAEKNALAKFMMDMGQPVYLVLLEQAQAVKKNPNAYTTAAPKPTTTASKKPTETATKKPTTAKKPTSTATTSVNLTGPDTVVTTPSSDGSTEDTTTTDGENVTTTLGGSSTSTTTAGTPSTAPTLERNPKPDTDTGDGLPIWVYIVLGGVLLGGGAVLCVLLLMKKKK